MAGADYFSKDPPCQVIGPQIGPIFDPSGVRITIALPHRQDIARLTCRLFDEAGNQTHEEHSKALHPAWRHFLLEFSNLSAGQEYRYQFVDEQDRPIDLQAGLSEEDCRFHAPQFAEGDRFVLLSCNNPFYSGLPEEKRFVMWERLLAKVSIDETIRLVIQGGDQVYHDDIEKDCLAKLSADPIDQDGVTANIIRNYQHYYGIAPFRKVMARIPSVAMLDDHDITDGWGGRPESFTSEGAFRPEWERYRDVTYEAFKAYQTMKNPPVRVSDGVETTWLDFGGNRLYLLDLRREKNIKDEQFPLVSAAHEEKLFQSISDVPEAINKVFVLSPVVPVRINPAREEALAAFAEAAYALRVKAAEELKPGNGNQESFNWWRVAYWATDAGDVAYLTDDLTDALSSKRNRKFLIGLVTTLAQATHDKGVRAVMVSGDIHVGGISEIFVRDKESTVCIPQIVSSPIGYEPMNRAAKNSTTEEWDYEIKLDVPEGSPKPNGPEVGARNIFYRADRNFCIVAPGAPEATPAAEFHFENLKEPLCCPVSFCGAG